MDPILVDLPTAIETERLVLRPPRTGDGLALFEAVGESILDLRRFLASLPWVAAEQSIEVSEAFCRNGESNFVARKDLPFLLIEKATGDIVGAAGLHRIVWATPKVEVGYWGRTSKQRRGFVTEAVTALVGYAFEHVRAERIELITDEENTASRKVAERCGFSLEGILRHERRSPAGDLRNTCIYARLR